MEEYMKKSLEEMNRIDQMENNEVIISDEGGERCRVDLKGDAARESVNKMLELYNKGEKMIDFRDIKIRFNGEIISFESIKDLNDWMKNQPQ